MRHAKLPSGQSVDTDISYLFKHIFHSRMHINKHFYPHAFLKKRRGYCNRLRPSVRPSVTLSPPKPLDEIQPNLVCGLLT